MGVKEVEWDISFGLRRKDLLMRRCGISDYAARYCTLSASVKQPNYGALSRKRRDKNKITLYVAKLFHTETADFELERFDHKRAQLLFRLVDRELDKVEASVRFRQDRRRFLDECDSKLAELAVVTL